mmetsp:Transcript_102154/g.288529  ORF Transcript_102154/g.288529 Transcript_102154/m.288529 type:complete len:99 (+) Transcript_102154:1642-1938(+)
MLMLCRARGLLPEARLLVPRLAVAMGSLALASVMDVGVCNAACRRLRTRQIGCPSVQSRGMTAGGQASDTASRRDKRMEARDGKGSNDERWQHDPGTK